MKHYFAYGANMDLNTMFDRCPSAKFIEVGTLDGYRFIINTRGVASIVSDATASVCGVIWTINEEDEAFLDLFEGVKGRWYSKHTVAVAETVNNNMFDCLVYIASDHREGKPIEDYFNNIIKWAKNFHFPEDYTSYLKSIINKEAKK
jgi:gamma-glutamylcyclotransferase (GGCT)/AIG2-like uncharacterized protein YtfP